MADTTEIVATSTGLGAFLGALLAAWKWRGNGGGEKTSPKNDGELQLLTARVTSLESEIVTHRAQLSRAEVDRREVREDLNKVFEEIRDVSEGVARIEGALGTRKGKG